MHKKSLLLTFLLSTSPLFAQSFSDDKYVQIVGDSIEVKGNMVNASGDVLIYSPNYFITANKIIYDKNTSELELFDEVNIIKDDKFKSFSQYAYIDMNNEKTDLEPFLLLDNNTNLWFNSTNSIKNKDSYQLTDATLSSCDCADPSWSVSFSEGDYNTTEKWINTYDATLYIKNIPVLYTPYFGFSTDKTRRTGLLKPTLGYSSNEGFLYAQPIYFAPRLNYDLEYIPQFRATRGHGHALKFRYKDSSYSRLDFEMGVFNEKSKYQKKMNLENAKHYGWDFKYKRDKVFTKTEHSDGLLVKLLDMNDVDYINTKYDNDTYDETDKFLESQLKYFYNTNNYYGDIDIKLYNDISKDNNDDVMQTLPSLNLHKFSDNLFFKNLTYSFDVNYINKSRKIGLGANSLSLQMPLSYTKKLFNDYLNFSLKEDLSFKNIEYTNNDQKFDNGQYGENNHIISLYSELIKPYEKYLHKVKFDTTFTYGNSYLKKGDIYFNEIENSSIIDDLRPFGLDSTKKKISLGVNQSLYNKKNLNLVLKHSVNQPFTYDKTTKEYKKDELENDIVFYHDYGSIANRITYDHYLKEFITSATTLKLNYSDYYANIYHKNTKDKNTLISDETVKYDLGFKFNKYYSTSYKEEYDLASDISKKKEYVFNIDKKCWGLNFKLIDSLVATNTVNDDAVLRQNILYIELDLKQLFKMNQMHKFDIRNQ